MELFIFISFQLLMEVQSYKTLAVKVSPDVLRESRSVKMICETPADVTVKQCYFHVNREQKNIKVSQSCELEFTGAEVLRWADVKSPASVDIYCFYTITEHKKDNPSSHSPAATVTVLGSLQKPIISASDSGVQINIACVIPLSVRADFNCSLYTEDVLLYRNVSQKSQSGEYHHCMFYLSYSELFTRSVNSRNLICDYYINTEPEIRSPRSDTHTIRATSTGETFTAKTTSVPHDHIHSEATSTGETLTAKKTPVFIPASAQPENIRESETSVPHDHIHSEASWLLVLVFTGIGLFLSGLMGFICLCHFASSDDDLTEVNYSSCHEETTSLLTLCAPQNMDEPFHFFTSCEKKE